jgi:hypothetical protein
MATFSQGSRSRLAYGVQADYSTAATTFYELPHQSNSLDLTKETLESSTLRFDRQQTISRHGNRQVGGDIAVEFCDDTYDDLLAAAMLNDWVSDEITIGTDPKWLTFEEYASDIDQARLYTGCTVNTLGVSISNNAMVTSTFGILGADRTTSATEKTVTDAAGNAPFDSYSGTVQIGDTGGTLSGSTILTSFELNIDNGMAHAFAIGSATAPQITAGMANVTFTATFYYEDDSIISRFEDETETALSISVGLAGSSDVYTFLLPRTKFNEAPVPVDGPDVRLITVSGVALKDDVEETLLKITRPTTV